MASADPLVMCEVKVELDVAEEPGPGPPWGSQHHCSGQCVSPETEYSCFYGRTRNGCTHKNLLPLLGTGDWPENSVSSTTTPCETDCWNPSAATMKCEPDSQPASGQGIKAEPVDPSVTGDMFHQFQSADNMDGKVDIKCEPCTFVDFSSLPLDPWNVVKSEDSDSEPNVWNNRSAVNFDWQTDSLRENISGEIIKKSDSLTENTSGDVQTEAVTDIMMTVTFDAVISQAISSRDEENNSPAGDQQNEGSCIRTTPQPSATDRTSLHKSANTSGSLLSLNRSHVCQHCSAAFVLFSFLKQHMASVHGEKLQAVFPESSTPESCDVGHCGNIDIEKEVGNLGDRKTVERKKDETDIETDGTDLEKDRRRHVCGVCSKAFYRAGDLKRHKLIHSDQKQFVCNVCNKTFTLFCHLKRHKLIHTDRKPFECDVCGKAFTQADGLRQHKLIHTGHKPFVCDVCSKGFTRSAHLKEHKLIHAGLKQFVCGVCNKAFTLAVHLKRHKLIHSTHKQFVCVLCSKGFTQAGNLKRHKLTHSHTGGKQCV